MSASKNICTGSLKPAPQKVGVATLENMRALILEALKIGVADEPALHQLKKKYATGGNTPSNPEVLTAYRTLVKTGEIELQPQLENLLQKRRVRSESGVSVVTVLTRDFGCPAACVFCPTAVGMPKSYLPSQPAAARAVRHAFDPFTQVASRLRALVECGHPASKIELIILGGTFTALPRRYRTWFLRRCLQALNQVNSGSLAALKLQNESAPHRLVGLTIETRPDWVSPREIRYLRTLGVTRVELGAQSLSEAVLQKVRRGHTATATRSAVQMLKDAGLKVGLHMMPNLPGATPATDLAELQTVFADPALCPDQLKIYPCMVLAGTALEKWWLAGEYVPYPEEVLAKLLTQMLASAPEWVRLSRLVRDIPTNEVLAGVRLTNFRQVLENAGAKSRDIRARELRGATLDPADVRFVCRVLPDPTEFFLSFETTATDRLVAFARLRLPVNGTRAWLRELHSYGPETAVGGAQKKSGQHRGYGGQLLQAAEEQARVAGFATLAIPAGLGVRPYYRARGYELRDDYMEKDL